METKRRTQVDWSKHELIVKEQGDWFSHELKKPDTRCQSIHFINAGGILAVTGDWGNWIFCRSFIPDAGEYRVSDGYWCEKLRISSTQKSAEYDPEGTAECLQKGIDTDLAEYGYEGEDLEKMKEYYRECKDRVHDGEFGYQFHAYNEYPSELMSAEDVPFKTKTPFWLLVVFDAFEEICKRLKEQENESPKTEQK